MMVFVKCPICEKVFPTKEIGYASDDIPNDVEPEKLKAYAIQSKVKFDCPECGLPVKLADCELNK